MDNVYGKWFNFKFYVDTETNKYAVKVNNKFVTLDNGDIWFTATADSTSDPGAASTETIGKIVSLEFGHDGWEQIQLCGSIISKREHILKCREHTGLLMNFQRRTANWNTVKPTI